MNPNSSIFPQEDDLEMNLSQVCHARPVDSTHGIVSAPLELYERYLLRNIHNYFIELRDAIFDRFNLKLNDVKCQLTSILLLVLFCFFFNIFELIILSRRPYSNG